MKISEYKSRSSYGQSVLSWLLYIMREEEDAAGGEIFSLVDGYQTEGEFSFNSLSCLKAAELKKKIKIGEVTKETGRFHLQF